MIGPSYTLRTVNYESQKTLNMFVESDEVGTQQAGPTAKEREPQMLVSVPGQLKIGQMPKSPIRGLHYTAFGKIICVAGNTVYYLNTPDNGVTWTAPTPIADLTTSTGPVCIADGIPNYYNGIVNSGMISLVVVVDGSNYGVVFEEGTTTAIQLNNGNSYNGASFVTFQDGFFVFTQNIQSPTCFFASDPLNISALDEVTVNLGPDYISRVISDHDILWIIGGRSSSVWQNTGGGVGSNIFQQIPGSYAEGGSAFPHTIAKASGQLLWVNSDDRGFGQVFMAAGYRGVRISNHAVEQWLQSFPSLVGASAWTYQDLGHTFYVLNVPGATTTWAYDLIEKSWSERAFFKDGNFSRDRVEHHIQLGANYNGLHLCGDYQNGNLYKLSNDVYTLNGEPIYRIRTAPHASNSLNRLFFSQAQADIEGGVGLDLPGYPYFVGYDTSGTPITTAVSNVVMDGSSPTWTFVDSNRMVQTPLTSPTPTISASVPWSNTYTITGNTLTATAIDFPVSTTQFGTGTGALSNFTFTSGGLASGTTITAADIYVSDWRGNNLQSTTPITNMCLDSENFTTSNWVYKGLKSVTPAVWNQYPTTIKNIYRPSANTTAIAGTVTYSSITNTANAYDSTDESLSVGGTYASAICGGGMSENAATITYTNFGSGINVTGTLNLSLATHILYSTTSEASIIKYSLDNGATFTIFARSNTASVSEPESIWNGKLFSTNIPIQKPLTIPDMSQFQIQVMSWNYRSAGSQTLETKVYDICFISATSTDSAIPENAPDGVNTGTYIVEDKSYGPHSLATPFSVNSGDVSVASCYYQIGDSTRNLEMAIQSPQVAFTASITGNQLTVVTPPTTGSLAVGMTIEGVAVPPNTTITAGTASPYTISWTADSDTPVAAEAMVAYTYIAKSHFTPAGVATSDIGSATITPVGTVFQGSITGNQLTVSNVFSGNLAVGQTISGSGVPAGLTITAGTASPYTLSATLSSPISSELMYVSAGATSTGIFRCSITGTASSTGIHHAGINLYNTNTAVKNAYVGNNASKLGIWGFQIQKDSLTKYIKSSSGVSGVDYITINLSTGTVSFNQPPIVGALLTWNGTVHGVSVYPLTLTASFSYSGYPAIYTYIGTDPQMSLSFSDDGGHTFSPERAVSMGRVGNYTRRCIWRRLGMSRDRVFRITCREPVKFSLIGWEVRANGSEIN